MTLGQRGCFMLFRWAAVCLVLFLAACQTTSNVDCGVEVDYVNYIPAGDGCLAITILNTKSAHEAPAMMVFIEGDVRGASGELSISWPVSRLEARHAILVDVSRPGYANWKGDKSSGTPQYASMAPISEIDQVANALENLKAHFGVSRLVVVGHSGGAAYAGVILGRYPDLIDIAVLHGCPCDMKTWHGDSQVRALDPIRYVSSIPKTARVVLIVGGKDKNTVPRQVENYADKLKDLGIPSKFIVTPYGKHWIDTNWSYVRKTVNLALESDLANFDEYILEN